MAEWADVTYKKGFDFMWILLALVALSQTGNDKTADNFAGQKGKPTIVNPSHPTDSRGESVYSVQGEEDKDRPTVPGELLPPQLVKQKPVNYSRRMKKNHFEGDVTVMGVVAPSGDLIDIEVLGVPDAEAKVEALKALSGYKFRPGTLGGKPVAEVLKIVLSFRID